MSRRPRVLVAGGIYHVYNRVTHGADVFKNEDEADRLEALVAETKKRRFSDPRLVRDVEPLPSRRKNGGGIAVAIDAKDPPSVFAELQRQESAVRCFLAGSLPIEDCGSGL